MDFSIKHTHPYIDLRPISILISTLTMFVKKQAFNLSVLIVLKGKVYYFLYPNNVFLLLFWKKQPLLSHLTRCQLLCSYLIRHRFSMRIVILFKVVNYTHLLSLIANAILTKYHFNSFPTTPLIIFNSITSFHIKTQPITWYNILLACDINYPIIWKKCSCSFYFWSIVLMGSLKNRRGKELNGWKEKWSKVKFWFVFG